MIALNQVAIPLVPVGTLDDSTFTVGTPDEWATVFAAQVAASRANGVVCRGFIYVSLDVATRMFGTSLPEVGPWNSPLSIQIFSETFEKINVFCDLVLSADSVRIE